MIDGLVNGTDRLVQYNGGSCATAERTGGGYVLLIVIGIVILFVVQLFLRKKILWFLFYSSGSAARGSDWILAEGFRCQSWSLFARAPDFGGRWQASACQRGATCSFSTSPGWVPKQSFAVSLEGPG
jgi:hypothetical protein